MLVIMTQDKFDEKLAAAQAEGRRLGRREWESKEKDARDKKRKAQNEEVERKVEKFSGVGIEILMIEQTSGVYHRTYPINSFSPPKYRVKFRTEGGIETEVNVSFDTPNFSMQDVRSAVHQKLCGGGCGC